MMSSPAVELLHSSPHVYIAINLLQNLSYILTGVAHLHMQMLFMLYAHTRISKRKYTHIYCTCILHVYIRTDSKADEHVAPCT